MSTDDKRRYSAIAFVTILLLSVFWPSPIVSSNRLWLEQHLAVDELSFLGREAPSWDVVFWCIAGVLALGIAQSGDFRGSRERLREAFRWNRGQLRRLRARCGAGVLVGAVIVAVTWLVFDAPLMAAAERIQSDFTESLIRIVNRFGGGMNPPMIVIFFGLAGLAYRSQRWVRISAAMTVASLSAGAVAHILKLLVGRARPELWLGPFQFTRGGANSFPSGHTVGAFALAGVLLFASRSIPLRVIAMILASAVGLSRILAFRHWPSDVVASACLGLLAAWVVVRCQASASSDLEEADDHRRDAAGAEGASEISAPSAPLR